MKVKICGITRAVDALYAAARGADFLGLVFVPESPRYVDPDRALAIAEELRRAGVESKLVGVFRDASAEYIDEVARVVGLDLVQLHGDESDAFVRQVECPAIKALRVGESLPETDRWPSADWLLFDTLDQHRFGGTGRRFDWALLESFTREKPFFLSGGITPENVATAIDVVRPDAIDLSSGVEESPGIKSQAKIDRLFEQVRGAGA